MDKVRVLVVDDSAVMRKIIASALQRESLIEVVGFAANGLEAIKAIQTYKPDVVTLDIEMPEMDGYQATHELKYGRGFAPPVIALTAHAMKGDREKCLAAGADDYLAKPVSHADLLAMLHKWVQ